jgi:hypothetical protein
MKTLLITLVFMMSMTTACSKDSSDNSGDTPDKTATTTNGEYSDLKSEPLTENMTNDNKSFSSPRGR